MNRLVLHVLLLCIALPVLQGLSTAAGPDRDGGRIFALACAGCHGLDAQGGEHAPNIVTSPRARGFTQAEYVRIIREGVPASGMPSFRSRYSDEELQSVAAYLKTMQAKSAAAPVTGDVSLGRSLFFGKAECSKCHLMEGRGGFLGPDLSDYASNHAADVLRLAIVEPNKNLDPRNYVLTVVTRDDRKFSGLGRNEDNFSLQLQAEDGSFHFFEKSEVTEIVRKPQSIMPGNYGATLTAQELSALISYIASSRHESTAANDSDN